MQISAVGPFLTFLLVFPLTHFFNSWALFIPQDHELPQQCELFSRIDAFFSFPGHEEHGKGNALVVSAMGTFQRSQYKADSVKSGVREAMYVY